MAGSERYVKLDEGLVSRKIFFDPEIYQLELERIFRPGKQRPMNGFRLFDSE